MNFEQLTFDTIMLPTEDGIFKIRGEGVSDEYIGQILRYGSNTENARRLIIAEYSKLKNENIAFLREIYHGGFGIQTEDGIVSVEWNDDIVIRKGATEKKITWHDIDDRIKSMITAGTFAYQDEIDTAFDCEVNELAQLITYAIRDTEESFEWIWEDLNGGGYPEQCERVTKAIKNNSARVAGMLQKVTEQRKNGVEPLRFARLYNIPDLTKRAVECGYVRKYYKSVLGEIKNIQMVITDYEIDRALGAGSGVSGGKARIKEYFEGETDKRKRQEFLKNEYGIGGHSHAVSGANHSGENHDGKGIELVKGDCRVMMNWAQVERRIDKIIKENRYG